MGKQTFSMDAERISSRKNKYIAHLRALASDAEYRYTCAEYLCDGMKLLAEALDKGARVRSVLWKDAAAELPGLDGAKQYIAPAELFDYASPMKNSPGPVFTLAMPEGQGTEMRRIPAMLALSSALRQRWALTQLSSAAPARMFTAPRPPAPQWALFSGEISSAWT